jgi:hypothetical protein
MMQPCDDDDLSIHLIYRPQNPMAANLDSPSDLSEKRDRCFLPSLSPNDDSAEFYLHDLGGRQDRKAVPHQTQKNNQRNIYEDGALQLNLKMQSSARVPLPSPDFCDGFQNSAPPRNDNHDVDSIGSDLSTMTVSSNVLSPLRCPPPPSVSRRALSSLEDKKQQLAKRLSRGSAAIPISFSPLVRRSKSSGKFDASSMVFTPIQCAPLSTTTTKRVVLQSPKPQLASILTNTSIVASSPVRVLATKDAAIIQSPNGPSFTPFSKKKHFRSCRIPSGCHQTTVDSPPSPSLQETEIDEFQHPPHPSEPSLFATPHHDHYHQRSIQRNESASAFRPPTEIIHSEGSIEQIADRDPIKVEASPLQYPKPAVKTEIDPPPVEWLELYRSCPVCIQENETLEVPATIGCSETDSLDEVDLNHSS